MAVATGTPSTVTPVVVPSPTPNTGSIPVPINKEQVRLLLLRWNALKRKGAREDSNPELAEITRVLKDISNAQKLYKVREDKIQSLRKDSRIEELKPSTSTSTGDVTGDNASQSSNKLDVLRAQIKAFQILSRNLDVPAALQSVLVNSVTDDLNDRVQQQVKEEEEQQKAEKQEQDPRSSHSRFQKSYDRLFKQYEKRLRSVGGKAEVVIRNRLSCRVAELEHLPGNLGTIDTKSIDYTPDDEISASEDILKLKAVIELKGLRLLTKQKSLRQHIVYSIGAKTDPLAESMMSRSLNRRIKVHTAQEMRLTEQLELQQRMERERKQRETQLLYVSGVCSHSNEVANSQQQRQFRNFTLSKSISQMHSLIEREESKRSERTAKQRLQALRSNDEDAYLKLLDQTKDTRITHLLKQTNSFLDSLAQAVKVQQQQAGVPMASQADDDSEGNDKIDYYEVAHRIKEQVSKQPSILVGGTLKEYQIKGLQWMVSLYNNNLNGILADEMGLGKTIQSISLITYLIEVKKQPGPYLVIVPLSTLTNWTLEFEKWAPAVKKVVYKGPPNARKAQQGIIRMGDFQVLLTTYEYIIKDRPILSKIKWTHMIIDEGHRMKNTNSKLSSTLTQYYSSRHRLILTGTPLQNNLPELWALLNFVLPKIFNSVKTFDEWFNTPFANTGGQDKMELTEEETLLIIRRLHKVLRPFLLRRLKKDVEKDLPDKVEKVIKCKMSAIQAKLYEQMLKHNILFIGDGGKSKMSVKGLNNRVMQLRKICNHPYVFEEVENIINPTRGNNDNLWRVAGKFELLDRIFPKFVKTDHRVLMFFQMTQIMDIMEDYLRLRGIQYLRLDGSTKADERSELLKLFNAPDSPYFCFLLSTRAGGLGLNLQTADTVIIYDTDWNPHQDLQAQDRAHRIGQTKEVRILRLITEDSVEEAILGRAHSKLEIDGKVIQAGKFDNKSTSEEQEAFLRSLLEAEEQRREQKDEDDEMDDDELNEILARSEEERELFNKMDAERNATSEYGKDKERDRLYGYDELPEEYQQDVTQYLEPAKEKNLGRGARERKTVYYDDGLTEEQWLDAVDTDAAALEEAIAKKRARMERRQERKSRLAAGLPLEDETSAADDDDDDKVKSNGASRKRKRSRSVKDNSSEPEDADEEQVNNDFDNDDDDEAEQSRQTKKSNTRNGDSRRVSTKLNGAGADPLAPKQRAALTKASLELVEVITSSVEDESGRDRSAIFAELPPKSIYPDYYVLIQEPIALNIIRKNIRNKVYKTLEEVKSSFDLMFANARTYNEPGSFVYEDADVLDNLISEKYAELKPSLDKVLDSDSSSSAVNGGVKEEEHENGSVKTSMPTLKIKLSKGREDE
ncbi:RSC chromatin remodeling complex ATPase subunit STH1 [Sugiyamaella lignohabitans]|uniref:RSC chromatin remodeling complex ATPase subunit STH1 n=1 Tax=Sugiyamaella lignohabitans TaxID=796027 RepID=A0A167DSF8_9ASCO|nr:RSC chromatin remodeling complex ATPase subunit STH1 [Sugiyamaella lignohabitans]ANB13236.1 RSC chromatin remodeling complex ATPase subunit STH1 [Sugiyamaella lignohabitans]